MITILYPKKAHIYCMHTEKITLTNGSVHTRSKHRIKDGTTGYQCPERYCRQMFCSDHWPEHNEQHVMEKLAR